MADVIGTREFGPKEGLTVGVVGLGYVGIATAVALAQHGRNVKCYERDPEKARRMRDGNLPIFEPGIEELFGGCVATGSITLCQSLAEVLLDSQVVFVAVGTPPASDGSPDLSYVDQVATEMAGVLQPGHVIVLKSTVPPDTYKRIRLTIERERVRMQLPPVDFDIGGGYQLDLNDVLDTLGDVLGFHVDREAVPEQPGDVRDTSADTSVARRVFGYEPRTSFEQGLRAEVDWVRELMREGL